MLFRMREDSRFFTMRGKDKLYTDISSARKHIALIKAGAATRNVLYSFGDKKRNIRICRPLTGTVKRRRSHYGTLRRQRC